MMEQRRRITIATIWYILTLVLAILSPDIGSVIDMLGSLAAIFIFVFPGKLCVQYVNIFFGSRANGN
jgi:sodium-coupled neutral amino acid transporter 7/8